MHATHESPATKDPRNPLKLPRRDPDFWASLGLLLLGILFFADFLFTSKNFYYRDILIFHYPLRKVLIDAFALWQWPLWNPYIFFGQPMLANPNYMAFYPTTLLHFFLTFDYAFKLHFLLHPLLAGPGFYFMQRRLKIGPLAALLGSIAYEFSGPVLSFLNLYNIVPAVALIPWIAWAFLGALEDRWLKRSLVFGVLLALQVLATEPLTFECTALILSGLFVNQVLESSHRKKFIMRALGIALMGALTALGLAAIQVIPTMELLPRAIRGAQYNFEFYSIWSVHPMDLVSTLLSNFYGSPYQIGSITSWGEMLHDGRDNYIVSYFMGSLTFLLLGVSFLSRRRTLRWILMGLGLIGLALALGKHNPMNAWLFSHVPLFGLGRFPSKYFLLCAFVIALLAALGIQGLAEMHATGRRWCRCQLVVSVLGIILSATCLVLWSYWRVYPQDLIRRLPIHDNSALQAPKNIPVIYAQLNQSLLLAGICLLLGSILILTFAFWKRPDSGTAVLMLVLLAEVLPANLRLTPSISAADLEFVSEVNKYLGESGEGIAGRVVPLDFMQPVVYRYKNLPNRSLAWVTLVDRRAGLPFHGIQQGIQYSICSSVDDLNTRESNLLYGTFLKLPPTSALMLLEKTASPLVLTRGMISDARASLERVFQTGTSLDLYLYRLKNAMPRAYFVSGVKPVLSHDAALSAFADENFAPAMEVVLEDGAPGSLAAQAAWGDVRIVDYQKTYVRCEVQAPAAGYLVLLDSYYPGWKAYVDGNESTVLRADYAFRAVRVASGRHQVDFRFAPVSFFIGLAITLLTILVLCCCWLADARLHSAQGIPATGSSGCHPDAPDLQ